jgi:hypothetical protein
MENNNLFPIVETMRTGQEYKLSNDISLFTVNVHDAECITNLINKLFELYDTYTSELYIENILRERFHGG